MHLLCPHCQNPIELVKLAARAEICCPSCGSSFRPEGESTAPWSMGAGQRLGKFELLRTVGQGAFGTVYEARDPQLDRTVAIKVLRAGNLATEHDRDRFLREARSVAQLRHPGIVCVHEVGEKDGLPYLVCDFVNGVTLADVLTGRRPGYPESADLIAQVADALQYAHDGGIVHRDVKPSNIMLESMVSRPSSLARDRGRTGAGHVPGTMDYGQAKLTDFGLAKRDAGEITMTMDGQILGTPAYMSPEQARGDGHRVDGQSDVYSLGVILYQLLTGELPFRGNTRMLLHQVLHDEPKPPRSLNDRIPRDVETICLKAMAKQPARRFPSAAELAADLRRYRAGEAIHARPVSSLEKAWRALRRHPVEAALVAALVLVFVAGSITAFVLWRHAEANLAEARTQSDRADRNFREARAAVDDFAERIRTGLGDAHGVSKFKKESYEAVLNYYRRFLETRGDDPELRAELAITHRRMGDLLRGLGQFDEAFASYAKAAAVQDQLVHEQSADDERHNELAATYNVHGLALLSKGRFADAQLLLEKSLRVRQELMEKLPKSRGFRQNYASSCLNLASALSSGPDPQAAVAWLEKCRGVREQFALADPNDPPLQHDLAQVLNNLGVHEYLHGDAARALGYYERARVIWDNLRTQHPDCAELHELAKVNQNLGLVNNKLERPREALARLEQAETLYKQLAERDPEIPDFRNGLAETYRSQGILMYQAGKLAEAQAALQKTFDLHTRLVADHPGVFLYERELAQAAGNLGSIIQKMKRYQEALPLLEEAHRRAEDLHRRRPDVLGLQGDVIGSALNLGTVLADLKRPAEAFDLYQKALARCEVLQQEQPDDPRLPRQLVGLCENLGLTLDTLNRPAEALGAFQKAIAQQRVVLSRQPTSHRAKRELAELFLCLVEFHRDRGQLGESAAASLERRKLFSDDAAELYAVAAELAKLAVLAKAEPERMRHADEALESLRAAVQKGFNDMTRLKTDPALLPLRTRQEFQKLLEDLEAKKP